MKFFVNDDCIGCGLCPSVCSEVFSMNSEGVAEAVPGEIDGELIFHGENTDQEYVVQKDGNGKYKLMQYKYHKGFGRPDVSNRP